PLGQLALELPGVGGVERAHRLAHAGVVGGVAPARDVERAAAGELVELVVGVEDLRAPAEQDEIGAVLALELAHGRGRPEVELDPGAEQLRLLAPQRSRDARAGPVLLGPRERQRERARLALERRR